MLNSILKIPQNKSYNSSFVDEKNDTQEVWRALVTIFRSSVLP